MNGIGVSNPHLYIPTDEIKNDFGQAQEAKTDEAKPQHNAQAKDEVQLGSSKQEMPAAVKPHKKWLFMNYIAADCNLTKYQLGNIDQQEKVGSDENTHVVAYVDVGNQYHNYGNWKDCRSYYVTKDNTPGKLNSEVIDQFGKTDMSKPETLTKFIVDAMGKFPADNVCLVLNDHGGGFVGAMTDDGSGNGIMSTPNLKKALADAEAITGKKIDVLGFDACLMAETEVAYELKDHANIYMASEESEMGPGWDYTSILGGANMAKAIEKLQEKATNRINVTPEEFAKIVIDVNEHDNHYIPTFSITDMSKMDGVKDAFNELAKTIQNSDDKKSIQKAIRESENYGDGYKPYGDLRDAGQMMDNLIANASDKKIVAAAKKAKEALNAAIIHNEVNPSQHPGSQGLTIYAPMNNPSNLGYGYNNLQFAKDTQWDEMITGKPAPKAEQA